MDDPSQVSDVNLAAALHSIGLDKWIPLILLVHAACSALDAAIPQPLPGSYWLIPRKIVSLLALNFANAANGLQPGVVSCIQRVVIRLAATMPPPGPKATLMQKTVIFLARLTPAPSEPIITRPPP